MKHLLIPFYILLFGLQFTFGQNITDIITGEKIIIHSGILDEDRVCLLSLPDSYNDSTNKDKNYPILILLDGSTHFKTASGIVHFMSSNRNRNHLMPETIIVAIENVDRERDFTITKIKTKRPNTMGGGRKFLDFIEKELVPYIDRNYRTEPTRTLVGHSLGGLLTLNSYMDEKSIFNAYISIDPSIWWNEEMMKNKVDSISSISLNKKLYIATANQGEANYDRNKKRHDYLYALMRKKLDIAQNVEIEYFEKEDHRSVPLIALYEGLKYINQDKTKKKEDSNGNIPSNKRIVKADINFKSNPIAESYRTVITEKYNELEVNFASYYVITTWGCGSGCVTGVMVDIRDGLVYSMPVDKDWGGNGTYIESKKESNVLITVAVVQSPSGEVEETRKYWEWDEDLKKFRFIKEEVELTDKQK